MEEYGTVAFITTEKLVYLIEPRENQILRQRFVPGDVKNSLVLEKYIAVATVLDQDISYYDFTFDPQNPFISIFLLNKETL
jgi:hypothetical protein